MGLAPGDNTTLTAWTVGGPGDGVDWLIQPRFRADTGIHSLDLQHLTGSSISIDIPTIVGRPYQLSFRAAAVAPFDTTGTVSAGSLTNQPFEAIAGTDFNTDGEVAFNTQTYETFTFDFSATGASTTITFTGTGFSNQLFRYGPVIDSVSVILVPEPLSAATLGLMSLVMLGMATRRRLG